MPKPSQYVCDRCGLPIRVWGRPNVPEGEPGDTYWKHSAGWGSPPSCGLPPIVRERGRLLIDLLSDDTELN